MTLSSITTKVQYTGDDSTTAFSTTFIFWVDSDVRVILTVDSTGVETVLVDGTHYNLTGGSGSTGTVTTTGGNTVATGETLTIKSNHPDTQLTDLVLGGVFSSDDVEEQLDKVVRLVQQLTEEIGRSFLIAETSTVTGAFPNPVSDNVIGWNTAATALENKVLSTFATEINSVFTNIATGEFMQYNGVNWVNVGPGEDDLVLPGQVFASRQATTWRRR